MSGLFEDHARLLAIVELPPAERHQALIDFGLNPDEPVPGTYRGSAVKNGPLVPIIIMRENSDFGGYYHKAFLCGQQVNPDRVWPWCATKPVPKEWHDAYAQGKGWPDEHQDAPAAVATIGGNNPPPADVLREQIERAAAGVAQYATITDAEHAARAQSLRSRLTGLAGEVDTARKAEKEPHLTASRAVDAKWMPLHDKAKGGADAIRKALSIYATDAAAKVSGLSIPEVKAAIKGGSGRAASVKTVTVVDEVTDWPALFMAFQANEELRENVLRLANFTLKKGGTVPGITTKQICEVK